MIRTFGGMTGLTNQPQGLDIGLGGGSSVKSVQRGSVLISAATSQTVTISPVDPSKSIIKYTVDTGPTSGNASFWMNGAEILNATTIQFTRTNAPTATDMFIYWEVIEFNNVKSKQTGISTVLNTSTTFPISSVNLNKSFVIASHRVTDLGTTTGDWIICHLSSSTALQMKTQSNTATAYWQVIEFL